MGFFSGYKGSMGLSAVLGGLGKLTAGTTARAKPGAAKVVAAFVNGESQSGVCSQPKGSTGRTCEINSDGLTLRVGSFKLAERATPDSRQVRVCIPSKGTIITDAKGEQVEAQSSKDVRAAAAALLRTLGAGVGVRSNSEGDRFVSGRRGRSRVQMPGECLTVRITEPMAQEAADMMEATRMANETAAEKGKKPTRRQVKAQLNANRKLRREIKAENRKERAKAAAAARKAKAAEKAAAEEAKREERNRKARERRAAERAADAAPSAPARSGPARGPGGRFVRSA